MNTPVPYSSTPSRVVIIGSGLGGLICGVLLAEKGYKVTILERNHQIGGMLQVFSREKAILDTGVHYVGSMNEGETLYQLFEYLNIRKHLRYQFLDSKGFDQIRFETDDQVYKFPQGMAPFIEQLKEYFPNETSAITQYRTLLETTCSQFPLYNLSSKQPTYLENNALLTQNAYATIKALTTNVRLQQVLAACNAFLYAGDPKSTPFYVHALIMCSYLKGAVRFIDGGSQIAIQLTKRLRALGGEIIKRASVNRASYSENGQIAAVHTTDDRTFSGDYFISNLHPSTTVALFGESHFSKPYIRRLASLQNSISAFCSHFIFHPNSVPYANYNIHAYWTDSVWEGQQYTASSWPTQLFISFPASSKSMEFAESISVMTFMRYDEVEEWKNSYHTVSAPHDRGESYVAFKKKKEEQVLQKVEQLYPGIRPHIKSIHSATPLTYRDYTGSPEGSMYGVMKDSNRPLQSIIGTKTHIRNLFLTGQNVFMHGILGTSLGALATCSHFMPMEDLLLKIKNA